MKKFHECGIRDTESKNAWFEHCRVRGMPYVLVHPRRKFARVEWDYTSMAERHDRWLRENHKRIIEELDLVWTEHVTERDARGGLGVTGHIDNVSVETARLIAGEVYTVLNRANMENR